MPTRGRGMPFGMRGRGGRGRGGSAMRGRGGRPARDEQREEKIQRAAGQSKGKDHELRPRFERRSGEGGEERRKKRPREEEDDDDKNKGKKEAKSDSKKSETAAKNDAKVEKKNAKQRVRSPEEQARFEAEAARRAADPLGGGRKFTSKANSEENKSEDVDSDDGEDNDEEDVASKKNVKATDDGKKKKKRRWKDKLACTLFVNQLPYDVTEQQIRKLFCSMSGITWASMLSVQMVLGSRGGFKGMAFIEFDSEDACNSGLKLDKATMWGRQINVGRAETKEKVAESRDARRQEARKQQDQASKTAREVAQSERANAQRKFGDLAKSAPYLIKDGTKFATTEDLEVLIERATQPRREKKKRGAGARPGQLQQRSTWKDFNEKAKDAMRKLPIVDLKRRLNAFYKLDVDTMRDKNAAFLQFLQHPL